MSRSFSNNVKIETKDLLPVSPQILSARGSPSHKIKMDRSGNEEDKELHEGMEAEGHVPLDTIEKKIVEEKLARCKAKYIERAQEKKVEMYFKALDVARLREGQDSRVFDVTFRMNFSSSYGQDLCIVGGAPELGNWDPSKAEVLTWNEGNNWIGHVKLTGVAEVEYKYIVRKGDQIHWEWGNNHVINLAKAESSFTVIDTWGAGLAK